jgi:tRNA (guanine6-N2)-methyltransferase
MSKKKRPAGRRARRQSTPPAAAHQLYEASVAEGLEAIARREIAYTLGNKVTLKRPSAHDEPGIIRFTHSGSLYPMLRLKTVQAVFLVEHFAIPRPRALLGDAYFRRVQDTIAGIRRVHPDDAFQTLYLSAAGEASNVLQRFRKELARAVKLADRPDEGDLLLRLRPSAGPQGGWDMLYRISPRPLATRDWRVCNMEGALNATVAHAITLMTDPQPYDVYLNLACGSGTLLIERLACGPAQKVIGCDTDEEARHCAAANIAASEYSDRITLHDWDARQLDLPDASVDALTADLPFGHLVGSHAENVRLYPAVLQEAARVAKPGSLFALITHEINLTQKLLSEQSAWRLQAEQRIALGGLYPRIFVLQRT